jgi:hypothetical protein
MTWASLPPLLEDAFPDIDLAAQLIKFLRTDLAAPVLTPTPTPLPPREAGQTPRSDPQAELHDEYAAAVAHALRTAPSVALARPGDGTERGIDVAFESETAARGAQNRIKVALSEAGLSDRVGVWLWRPKSLGLPTTEAGRTTGMELRLQPKTTTK